MVTQAERSWRRFEPIAARLTQFLQSRAGLARSIKQLESLAQQGKEFADSVLTNTGATHSYSGVNADSLIVDESASSSTLSSTQYTDKSATAPQSRYDSSVDEPAQPPRQCGHIPGAINIPAESLLSLDGRQLLPVDQLAVLFDAHGVVSALKAGTRVVTYSGTGVAAAMVNLALCETGYPNVALYDGSFAEYGNHPDAPAVATRQ